jgi:hypothetical protein
MTTIVIDSFIDLEREYMRQNVPYLIEEQLLNSLSKEELKSLIELVKDEYVRQKLPYEYQLWRKKIKEGYEELNAISKYFIEIFEYYFSGWQEIELTKKFLERISRFYKMNYDMNNNYKKQIDVQSIPIREIVEMYTRLPDNLRRNIRCPFPGHNDSSASFRIYEHTNSFHCFGCIKSGNIVNFIANIENIDQKSAFKKIIKLYS